MVATEKPVQREVWEELDLETWPVCSGVVRPPLDEQVLLGKSDSFPGGGFVASGGGSMSRGPETYLTLLH